jgi:uncharacterized protein YbjT (DUF2867 family)
VPPQGAHPDPIAYAGEVARAVRGAAREAGLDRLVLLSSEGAYLPSGTGPIRGLHAAEGILADAAARVTFLRGANFQENWLSVFGVAREQGILPTFLVNEDRPRSTVATADIGRTAADLLQDGDAPSVVELTGPRDLSVRDVASIVGATLGRTVNPVHPPCEAWAGILMQGAWAKPTPSSWRRCTTASTAATSVSRASRTSAAASQISPKPSPRGGGPRPHRPPRAGR